jgi:hypothetical protein
VRRLWRRRQGSGSSSPLSVFLRVYCSFWPPSEYQKVGQDSTDATKNDLWTGGALIAISTLTLILFAAFALRDAVRAVEQESTTEPGES